MYAHFLHKYSNQQRSSSAQTSSMQAPLTQPVSLTVGIMARLGQLLTHLPNEVRKFTELRQSLQACHLQSAAGERWEKSGQVRGRTEKQLGLLLGFNTPRLSFDFQQPCPSPAFFFSVFLFLFFLVGCNTNFCCIAPPIGVEYIEQDLLFFVL